VLADVSDDVKFFNELIDSLAINELSATYKSNGASLKETKALGRYIEAELINSEASRSITVAYLPVRQNHVDVLMVHVGDLHNGTFTVEQFLIHEKIQYNEKQFDINTYQGSKRSRIQNALAFNISVINTYLYEVISGKTWVDIPFDWGEYK
jgi:hypothetical protein